jgi:uncharacterized protein (TIGR02594 family)
MNKAYKFAQSKLGLKEIKGAEHNPQIIEMFAAVGHSWITDDETPWCAAFVGWCLKSVRIPHLNEVAARKYEKYGNETKTPAVGDIVVIWRGSPASWMGHVGFLHSMDEKYIHILGGNQGNEVSVRRYERKRLLSFRSVAVARNNDYLGLGNEIKALKDEKKVSDEKIKKLEKTAILQTNKITNQSNLIINQKEVLLKLQTKKKEVEALAMELYNQIMNKA